jgi:pyruvate/2-oxoglutarate dehydrogenase complex dihydrolipoamide acyltransferase (E2) component
MTRSAPVLALLALTACSAQVATSPADGAPATPATSSATPPVPVASAPASAEAPASAAAAPSAVPGASAAPPSESAAPEAPLPAVKVANIGMHIGGGPNDDVTKDPIRRSVQPHFDAFRRCFGQVEEAKKGDFGVDLRIGAAGGKAEVSHPRTSLKGKAFRSCVLHTFEAIDFLKPRGGKTTVSYSLRFTPG